MDQTCVHCQYSVLSDKETDRRDLKSYTRASALTLAITLLIFIVGFEVEQLHISRLPDTDVLYATEQVCGLNLPSEYSALSANGGTLIATITSNVTQTNELIKNIPRNGQSSILLHSSRRSKGQTTATTGHESLTSATYASADEVRSHKGIVQHCGNCGKCSNPQDVAIYDETRNSLFKSSLHCSTQSLLFGRQAVSSCLQQSVGFTDGCNDCWVENIMCDARNCLFTCAWTALMSKIKQGSSTDNTPQELNACLQCDEKRCGPAFLKCAGANRRRAGILSDIRRDSREVCQDVDTEWWKSDSLQAYYQLTKEAEP